MTVVTPHEFFMALEPETFPWESRVITDFNQLLPRLLDKTASLKEEIEEAMAKHNLDESALAVIKKEHHELVPIFSS
jgi:hypothetical protein